MSHTDILEGKKWYACGDSFTEWATATFEKGELPNLDGVRYFKSYPYFIAKRNPGLTVFNAGLSGQTMAYPKEHDYDNCFSNELYKNVWDDADYITLYFGINDSHHRECYINIGKCANEDFHFQHKKWERKKIDIKPEITMCSNCGTPNISGTEQCVNCGEPLINEKAESGETQSAEDVFQNLFSEAQPYLGFNPDEDLGGATVKEVSDFVGTNTIYYLPIFKRMKDFGTKISFNVTCLFFPSLYFANRKMWGWAIFASLLSVILGIPAALIYIAESGAEGIPEYILTFTENYADYIKNADAITTVIEFVLKIGCCLLSNRMYFKYIVRSVNKFKKQGEPITALRLNNAGGVNPVNMLIIVLVKIAITFLLFTLIGTAAEMLAVLNDFS